MTEKETIIKRITKFMYAERVEFYIGLFDDLNECVKALNKQIAKKPRFVDVRYRHHGRLIADGCSLDRCYECPSCRSHIFHVFESEVHCKYCGQKLDWGNEDDRD